MTYYTRTALPRYNLAQAESVNAELAAIEAAFDKLPAEPALSIGSAPWATIAGGPDTYTATFSVVPTAYADGMTIEFTATGTNTGPVSIDVNSLGVKPVVNNETGAALAAGEIPANSIVRLVYSETQFRLMGGVAPITVAETVSSSYNLAGGSMEFAAGSNLELIGTSGSATVLTIQDGTAQGQLTRFYAIGTPAGNVSIWSDGDPGSELVGDVIAGRSYIFRWNNTQHVLVENGITGELGPFATAETIAAAIITADNSATDLTFANVQAAINALAVAVAAAGGAPEPAIVTSNASPFALTDAMRASENVIVQSHQASVAFQVPAAATPGDIWLIEPLHSGGTATTAAGSISGTTNLIKGRLHAIRVVSNPGSAPVSVATGGVVPGATVSSTRSYTEDDHEASFYLDSSAGDQTMPAAAAVPQGWTVFIKNRSGSAQDIIGADATHSLADDGYCFVEKDEGGALVLGGTGASSLVELDVA